MLHGDDLDDQAEREGCDGVASLRRIAADCDRVARVASELKKMFGDDGSDALRALHDDAAAVATHAREVERTYRRGGTYDDATAAAGNGTMGMFDPPVNMPQSTGPGNNTTQRFGPRGNPAAGPRGVGTGGVGTGTR